MLSAAAMLVLAAPAHAAEVCKWTDENGRAQFGDCRVAPSAGAKLDVRPASGDAPPPPPAPATARRAGVPSLAGSPAFDRPALTPAAPPPARNGTRFPPAGTPPPAGWTSTCEQLAHRILDLPRGTPYPSEADQILRGCPGITYHCEFRYLQPETNRCGPIVRERGLAMINTEYTGYPPGAKLPTYRDVTPR